MRTQVFVYKGVLGIKSAVDADGLLNKPMDKGQLGFVVDAAHVDIQQEAIDWMRELPRTGDDIGAVDSFQSDNGPVVFSWLGGPMTSITKEEGDAPSSTDFGVLTASPDVEVPEDFKNYIDGEQ